MLSRPVIRKERKENVAKNKTNMKRKIYAGNGYLDQDDNIRQTVQELYTAPPLRQTSRAQQ